MLGRSEVMKLSTNLQRKNDSQFSLVDNINVTLDCVPASFPDGVSCSSVWLIAGTLLLIISDDFFSHSLSHGGGGCTYTAVESHRLQRPVLDLTLVSFSRLQGEILEMVNEGGPLGIHVVPEYDESGRCVTTMTSSVCKS